MKREDITGETFGYYRRDEKTRIPILIMPTPKNPNNFYIKPMTNRLSGKTSEGDENHFENLIDGFIYETETHYGKATTIAVYYPDATTQNPTTNKINFSNLKSELLGEDKFNKILEKFEKFEGRFASQRKYIVGQIVETNLVDNVWHLAVITSTSTLPNIDVFKDFFQIDDTSKHIPPKLENVYKHTLYDQGYGLRLLTQDEINKNFPPSKKGGRKSSRRPKKIRGGSAETETETPVDTTPPADTKPLAETTTPVDTKTPDADGTPQLKDNTSAEPSTKTQLDSNNLIGYCANIRPTYSQNSKVIFVFKQTVRQSNCGGTPQQCTYYKYYNIEATVVKVNFNDDTQKSIKSYTVKPVEELKSCKDTCEKMWDELYFNYIPPVLQRDAFKSLGGPCRIPYLFKDTVQEIDGKIYNISKPITDPLEDHKFEIQVSIPSVSKGSFTVVVPYRLIAFLPQGGGLLGSNTSGVNMLKKSFFGSKSPQPTTSAATTNTATNTATPPRPWYKFWGGKKTKKKRNFRRKTKRKNQKNKMYKSENSFIKSIIQETKNFL